MAGQSNSDSSRTTLKKARRSLRPPFLLYAYIATELLAPFFASFIILSGVFFLVRLIPMLEVMLSLGIGLADFIRLLCYIFPNLLLYIIPMASMVGVIIGFTRMTNDREILVLKSCGVSLRQMLVPVVLFAAAIALLTGFFSLSLIPTGAMNLKHLMFQLAKEKIDQGFGEKEFTEALGDLVVYVDRIDKQSGHWHGVYVSDMRERDQPLITMARSGSMEIEPKQMVVTVTLNNGSLHSNEGRDSQMIHFQRYQLQIALQAPTKVGKEDIGTMSRGGMSQQQLLATAARLGEDTPQGRSYLSEYYQRLGLPLGCFILSLLAVPLGLQAGPGHRAIGIPLGLGFFLLYYVAFTAMNLFCEKGALPMAFGMGLPNLGLFLLVIVLFFRVEQEKSLVPECLQVLAERISERWLQPLFRRLNIFWYRLSRPLRRHRRLQKK